MSDGPVQPQPTPISFSVGMVTATMPDGKAQSFVVVKFDTFSGSGVYHLDPESAHALSSFLADVAQQVERVEFLPPNGSPFAGPRAEDGAPGPDVLFRPPDREISGDAERSGG